jgi:hypothetical protein
MEKDESESVSVAVGGRRSRSRESAVERIIFINYIVYNIDYGREI